MFTCFCAKDARRRRSKFLAYARELNIGHMLTAAERA